MKRKINKTGFLLLVVMLVSCGPAMLPQTATPTTTVEDSLFMTAQMGSTLSALLTLTAESCASCSADDVFLTSQMATAFASTPSNTPPPGASIVPAVGDLGWGSVNGKIIDGLTFLPIKGATVRCEHSSYSSQYRCQGVTTTDENGLYVFVPIFLHDTDRIRLIVEAPGYETLHFEESHLTQPDIHIDLGLFPTVSTPPPSPTLTSTPGTPPSPIIVCTPPACSNGVLACGLEAGCPGGCGTVCLFPPPTP